MVFLEKYYTQEVFHLTAILFSFFLTYFRILGKDFFWVIDDLEGISRFSERWDDKEQKKIDSYDLNGKQKKFLEFIPELGFPGNVFRYIRLQIGKKFQVIGKNSKGHEIYGYVQSPIRHHIFSMSVQVLNLIMAYAFLKNIMPPYIAFGACLLYAVSPLTASSVAWISGYNYNFSMFFSLALLNTAMTLHIPEIKYILIAILSFLSTITIYTGAFTFLLLWFLGLKVEAVIAGLVGFSIIAWKGMEVKSVRVKAFHDQNMGNTTFFKPRKLIVMVKTLWYYMRTVWLPIKMGLYHVWGYFYEEPLERIDRMFWFGILTLGCFAGGFFYGPFPVKFAILWFFTYFILFSNFITAQQFLADRYVMVPSFGMCIIISYFLFDTPLFWIIFGLYMMRTIVHLPTYKNEVDFYISNFLNFRKSEVSLGNLGVAFINQGMHGAAVDTWMMATKINPYYDVPWYNLYSVFKGNGRLAEAKEFLKRCLDAKVVHFDKKWKEEMTQLDDMIEASKKGTTESFYYQAADHYKVGDTAKEHIALKTFMSSDTKGIIPEMIEQVKQRLAEIEGSTNILRHSEQEQKGKETAGSNSLNKGTELSPRPN